MENFETPAAANESAPPGGMPRPIVRYSDEDLEFFRGIVNKAKKDALEEMRMLQERLDDLANYGNADDTMIYSMHMAEQGSEAIEKDKTYVQINRINEYLRKLDEALRRVDDKTYGV